MLKEAKRLYNLGWACHWIKPKSKAPVKAGWSGPTRDEWDLLEREYVEGYGLGVRLGESSKIGEYFLANIDVDIKGDDKRYTEEALNVVRNLFPTIYEAPLVKTGYGFRYFVLTKAPMPSGKLASSPDTVVVHMPTAEVNRQQERAVREGLLTSIQLNDGYRVRKAWEIEFMSSGKQVVLPPSIHPDTKKRYKWIRPVTEQTLPLVDPKAIGGIHGKSSAKTKGLVFEPVPVALAPRLPTELIDMILMGDGVEDRSAACFKVAMAMCRAQFTDDEILTVLTDQTTFLGETAYDHRRTESRSAAAAWVRDYCVRKAREETSAAKVFESEIEVEIELGDVEAIAQTVELVGERHWQDAIKRSGKEGNGTPKATLENTVLILENHVNPAVFRRDTFASKDFYGVDTPWGGKAGASITDEDAVKIIHWLGKKYHFEPPIGTTINAMVLIATKNEFHPIREELNALEPWDGVGRLDTWLRLNFEAKGPSEYLAQVFRKWMVASVARIFEPGFKFDWMPIFQGAQGTGKSSFGKILFGESYFVDWLPVLSDKDAAFGLRGIRCMEFGELASLRKNELDTTKAFITRTIDRVRPVYGRLWVDLPRQCVFFGTTNMDTYLKDDSGNRRFNPVEVGWLDFDALARDRAQLWAEALFIYRNGLESSLYLDNGADAFATKIQSEKMVEDESVFMAEDILNYIKAEAQKPFKDRFDFSRFRLMDLFTGMGPLQKYPGNGRSIQFASKALKSVGGQNWKSDGTKVWKIDLRDTLRERGK